MIVARRSANGWRPVTESLAVVLDLYADDIAALEAREGDELHVDGAGDLVVTAPRTDADRERAAAMIAEMIG